MAITQVLDDNQSNTISQDQNQDELMSPECEELLSSLPKAKGWRTENLFLFQGFWCQPKEIKAIVAAQKHYKALHTDLILVTIPKSGTTWLKALAFSIVRRNQYQSHGLDHPLHTSNPHELVPFFEYKLYANNQVPNMSTLPTPRLLATHVPYGGLPESVRVSRCKLVYLVRNPFDTFVSIYHYMSKIRPDSMGPFSIEEAFDMYCEGSIGYGPYWNHMLGYWNESLKNPDKVLFLKYEEMKEETVFYVKKMADFLGFPFSLEEEEKGIVEEIVKLCSFEHLKELDVNKKGKGAIADFENKNLFRKGEVGDWVNYLTPLMAERLTKIMHENLAGSGLSFKLH